MSFIEIKLIKKIQKNAQKILIYFTFKIINFNCIITKNMLISIV